MAVGLMQAAVAILIGSLVALLAYLVLEPLHLRPPQDPAVVQKTRQLMKLRCQGTERTPFDWDRTLGGFKLVLGFTGLALAVIPVAWRDRKMPNLPDLLNLVPWLGVAMLPIGLSVVSVDVSRLRRHNNHRVRRLANCAVGLPGHAATTRAGRVLLLALGLSVALGAATWDALAEGGHPFAPTVPFVTQATPPWMGPLVLAVSLVGSWVLALGAVGMNRTRAVIKNSGTYLLGGTTIAMLVLGVWSHRQTLQQLPCVVRRARRSTYPSVLAVGPCVLATQCRSPIVPHLSLRHQAPPTPAHLPSRLRQQRLPGLDCPTLFHLDTPCVSCRHTHLVRDLGQEWIK